MLARERGRLPRFWSKESFQEEFGFVFSVWLRRLRPSGRERGEQNTLTPMSPLAIFSRLNKTFCNPSLTLKLQLNIKKKLQMLDSFDWVFDVSFSLGLKRVLTGLDNPLPHLITH